MSRDHLGPADGLGPGAGGGDGGPLGLEHFRLRQRRDVEVKV